MHLAQSLALYRRLYNARAKTPDRPLGRTLSSCEGPKKQSRRRRREEDAPNPNSEEERRDHHRDGEKPDPKT